MRLNVEYNKLNAIEKVEYVQQLIAMSKMESLDREVTTNDGDYTEFGQFIADTSPGPDELLESKMTNEKLLKLISTLRPREQIVIKLRFGLYDGCPRTLEEIGKIYNLTRERVRQVEKHALKKLRLKLIKNNIKHISDL